MAQQVPKVQSIVFSKDRAFQLEQLLNSLTKNTDLNRISVLYTASNVESSTATSLEHLECDLQSYQDLARMFPQVNFVLEKVYFS
jgi:hypothetical protein